MLLYLWVNKFRHIEKTGFNLSSLYEFDFKLLKQSANIIRGRLVCKKKSDIKLFKEPIVDIKAIVGENGAGKSTIIDILVQNILTKPVYGFDGFLVTEDYVFNRKGIDFGKSISEIKDLNLKEVNNVDLVNFNRTEFQNKVTAKEIKPHFHGQIATTYLKHLSIIHYSPLLDIDRIYDIEGVAGSSRLWETDYWHYYDYTTSNAIVSDYHSLNIGDTYYLTGESELLAHKILETKRTLQFLMSDLAKFLPFVARNEEVNFRFNDFYSRFWESIDSYFKLDEELSGRIEVVFSSVIEKEFKGDDPLKKLESQLYTAFIYGVLKYEYRHRMNFGRRKNSNAIRSTIDLFLNTTQKSRLPKTILKAFLNKAQFAKNLRPSLFNKIKSLVDFIIKSKAIRNPSQYGFDISIRDKTFLEKFIEAFYEGFIFEKDEQKINYQFSFLNVEYRGLSSGEKNLISMFSRIKHAADSLPKKQKEIVFLLDEPEVTLHPQWQTSFIHLINEMLPKFFPQQKIQIIITSHSPILLSDFPANNSLFLEKDDKTGNCIVSKLKGIENTFGANIHSLYTDGFFLRDKGGTVGKFAKDTIHKVISLIKEANRNEVGFIKSVIAIVGEPLIKNQLLELFYEYFPEEKANNIDDKIKILEELLVESRLIKLRQHESDR